MLSHAYKHSCTHTYIHIHIHMHKSAFVNATFHNWMVGGSLAGEVKSGGGLTFISVENAGHQVPMDQPKAVSACTPVTTHSATNTTNKTVFTL